MRNLILNIYHNMILHTLFFSCYGSSHFEIYLYLADTIYQTYHKGQAFLEASVELKDKHFFWYTHNVLNSKQQANFSCGASNKSVYETSKALNDRNIKYSIKKVFGFSSHVIHFNGTIMI